MFFDCRFNLCWIELGFDMARRRSSSSESSEDDVRRRSGSESEDDERDEYKRGGRSGRKSSGHRRDDSDRSDSGEERKGAERDGGMGSDKKSRSRERKERSESSEEEGQIVNKKRVSEENERLPQDYDRRGGRDAEGDSRGDRDSRRVNGQSERQVEKESHRLHHSDRWRGGEEDKSRIVDRRGQHDSEEDHRELTRKSGGYSDRDKRRTLEKGGNSDRDRRSRYDSEEDDRELARKSERDRDRRRRVERDDDRDRRQRAERDDDRDRRRRAERDDDNERNHRDKGVSKYQEESRKKENGNGRTVGDANPQRQTSIPGGNLNGDASNLGRSGGVYIPPFKMAMMMKEVQDKSSVEYQRLTWDALRKSINGLVNKVNATNIKNIIPELFSENLIRGRGLFCRSCMKSQMASPGFTDVFAALVAVVNTKFPEVGDLLLRRIVLQLKRAYKRNDKVCGYSS